MLQGKAKGNSMITNIRNALILFYIQDTVDYNYYIKNSSHNPWFLHLSMIDHYEKRRHTV